MQGKVVVVKSSMPTLASTPASTRQAPILVELWRGDMVECRHRGSVAVVDARGQILETHGEVDRPVYPRSAMKPLQALPLIECGAADALAVSDAELALACASHGGEPRHVDSVLSWLRRLDLAVDDLECGAHWPSHVDSQHALIRAGLVPTAAHNNCSGKHAGMLATCRHLGEPTRGYSSPEHPAQRRVVAVLEAMCGADFRQAPRGIDGCGLPQIGIPLLALARAMARLGAPDALSPPRAAACRRIARAMTAHPFMVAGSDRFCTRLMELGRGEVVAKTGAEGVYVAAIPKRGIGIALKIEDGATRAAEVALCHLVGRLAALDDAQLAALETLRSPPVVNAAGRVVGKIGPSPGW